MNTTMTIDEAIAILKGDIYTCPWGQLQEALKILETHNPNHPLLASINLKVDAFKSEKSAAVEAIDPSETMQSVQNEREFSAFLSKKDNKDIAKFVERTEVLDATSSKPMGDKERHSYLSLLFADAKLKAEITLDNVVDAKQKDKNFKENVKQLFFENLAQTAIASKLDKPTSKEEVLGSPEHKDYLSRNNQKAVAVFNDIINSGKTIAIKADSILSACADTAVGIENHIRNLRNKASKKAEATYLKLIDYYQTKKDRFEKLANTVSQNRYEIWKNIKGSFSDNKFKLIGNIGANAAFGYWTAAAATSVAGASIAPVVVPALAAYAAYHAAGSWVFPIVAEMRKINRKKREAGEKTLDFKTALKQAWKNKTSNRKDLRTYVVGGALNTSLAVVGFSWLKNGMEAADAAMTLTDGVGGLNVTLASNIASTRHAISMGRMGTASVAQLTDAAIAYGVSIKDPNNKEKSAEFKQLATSAVVGLGFNALFQSFGFSSAKGAETVVTQTPNQEHLQAATDGIADAKQISRADSVRGFFSRFLSTKDNVSINNVDTIAQAPISQPDSLSSFLGQDSVALNQTPESDATQLVETTIPNGSLFPDQFTSKEEMGITQSQYNVLVNTTEGTLKSATGDEVTLDRAYLNLDNAMEHFPNKTKEEVIYKFNRLYAFMRKAYEVGDGTLRETPSGQDYLANKFANIAIKGLDEGKISELVDFAQANTYADKGKLTEGLNNLFPEGLDKKELSSLITTINSNQRFNQNQEEMEALIKLLGCGEAINAEQAKSINVLLDNTDALLKTGKANTILTGLNLEKDCHDDDGQWRKVATTVVQTPKEAPAPVEVPLIMDNRKMMQHETILPTSFEFNETVDPVLRAEVPEVAPEAPQEEVKEVGRKVRKVAIDKMSQLNKDEVPGQKVFDGSKAARILKRHGQSY